jgi:curved DNA-binding protein
MDHYQTLGINRNATPDEIKKAYRKLASQHHPDKGGDTATFQRVEEAYRVLSDPNMRQQYDNPQPQGFPGGFHGGFPGGFHFNMNGFDLGDMFEQMFRPQGHHNPFQRQQQVLRTSLGITLEQAYKGGEQVIKFNTQSGLHTATIQIPKGVPDGGQIRYDNIIPNAIVVIEFRIQSHLKFERKQNDLYCNHSISVLDLIVGSKFKFECISGKTVEVTVPPKTQPYMHLKVAGEGMPILNTNMYGDQIILLKPFIPDKIDESITQSILRSKNS